MQTTLAASFGFYAVTTGTPGAAGYGDGNGVVSSGAGPTDGPFMGEPIIFWRHLSDSQLIEGRYAAGITTAGELPSDLTTTALVNTYLPVAKLGKNNSLSVMGDVGVNYLVVAGINTIAVGLGGYTNGTNNIAPVDAWNLDTKMDDGVSSTGSVRAINAAVSTFNNACAFNRVCAGTIPNCVVGGFTGAYVLTGGDTPECSLSFKVP